MQRRPRFVAAVGSVRISTRSHTRPRRLARSRTSGFHPENTGSNPVGVVVPVPRRRPSLRTHPIANPHHAETGLRAAWALKGTGNDSPRPVYPVEGRVSSWLEKLGRCAGPQWPATGVAGKVTRRQWQPDRLAPARFHRAVAPRGVIRQWSYESRWATGLPPLRPWPRRLPFLLRQ